MIEIETTVQIWFHVHTLPTSCVESPYLCHSFASQLVETHVNVKIRPGALPISKIPLATFWQTFMIDHHFFLSWSTPSLGSADFPSQNKVAILWVGIWPVTIAQYCSVIRIWTFSEGHIKNHWSVKRCHLKVIRIIRDSSSSLTQGISGNALETITTKMTVPFPVSWDRRVFN